MSRRLNRSLLASALALENEALKQEPEAVVAPEASAAEVTLDNANPDVKPGSGEVPAPIESEQPATTAAKDEAGLKAALEDEGAAAPAEAVPAVDAVDPAAVAESAAAPAAEAPAAGEVVVTITTTPPAAPGEASTIEVAVSEAPVADAATAANVNGDIAPSADAAAASAAVAGDVPSAEVPAAAPADVAPAADAAAVELPDGSGAMVAEIATPGDAGTAEVPAAAAAEVPTGTDGAPAEAGEPAEAAAAEVAAAADAAPAEAAPTTDAAPETPAEVPADSAPAEAPAAAEPAAAPAETPTEAVPEAAAAAEPAAAETPADAAPAEAEAPAAGEAPAEVAAAAEPEAAAAAKAEEEEGEDKNPLAVEDLIIIDETGDLADAAMAGADSLMKDTGELLDEVQKVEDAKAALEAYIEDLRIEAGNGGVPRSTIRAINIGLEHIYNTLDEPIPDAMSSGFPAMESFDLAGARPGATTVAMEALSVQVKSLLDTILAGIQKAVDWLAGFFDQIFTAHGRMKARGEALMKTASTLKNPVAQSIASAHVVKGLCIGKSMPSNAAGAVMAAANWASKVGTPQEVNTAAGLLKLLEDLAGVLNDEARLKTGQDALRTGIEKMVAAGLKKINDPAALGISAPEGTSVYTSDVFPGNRLVWAAVPASSDHISSYRIGIHVVAQDIPDNAQARVLSPNDIAAMGKIAVEFSASMAGTFDAAKRLADSVKNVAQLANKISAAGGQGETSAQVKIYIRSLRAAVHLAKGLHQPAMAMGSAVVNAGLEYAAQSVKAYAPKPVAATPNAAPAAA